jgi:hypothetical protein
MNDAWMFADPPNLAVLTMEAVLSGDRPVLYVSHDVFDGSWQFLTGDDFALDQAKVVPLGDVVQTDVTLQQLFDLPLGWSAERRTPGAEWKRQAQFPTDWDDLLSQAEQYTAECQERLKSEFSLLEWERYSYNQEAASLIFSSGGVPRVTMKIQVVGSWAKRTGTWLWSWDNASILASADEYVHWLKTFGEQNGFARLSNASWQAEEVDAWEMTSLACLLLQGEGVYRAPDDDGALFMVLSDPEFIDS